MRKSGFHDPIAIKKEDPKATPKDGKNSPWDFRAPDYDERSSCFVNAGTHYGVGHTQPVGSHTHSSAGPIPYGKHHGMKTDEAG